MVAFNAARHLPSVAEGSPSRRMHGHRFEASWRTASSKGVAQFSGDETTQVARELAQVVEPLDFRLLNDILTDPTDERIAQWVKRALAVEPASQIGLQSSDWQGVVLDAKGAAQHWRRYRIEAAHFLPNVPAGHKCGRLHGHGFEISLHARFVVTEPGALEPYATLDAAWAPLQERLHLRCLNDIPGLENPTAEVLAAWIWAELSPRLPGLTWVSCYETATSGAHFDGRATRIWKERSFDAATRLRHAPASDGCSRIHGHTYTTRLHLSAPIDTVLGWVVDFGDVKRLFEPVYRELDHHPLHEREELADGDAASLAQWIRAQAQPVLPELDRLDLYERPKHGVLLTWSETAGALPI